MDTYAREQAKIANDALAAFKAKYGQMLDDILAEYQQHQADRPADDQAETGRPAEGEQAETGQGQVEQPDPNPVEQPEPQTAEKPAAAAETGQAGDTAAT